MRPDLSVQVCGQQFKNPIIVTPATSVKDTGYIKRCIDYGAGGIITKTISCEPMLQKYVSPRFTVLHKKGWPYAFSDYSCEFLDIYTPDEWIEELTVAAQYCHKNDTVLIGSISGGTADTWSSMAKQMAETGVDMLELNFACPHPRNTDCIGTEKLGSDIQATSEAVKAVVDVVDLPVFAKITAEAVNPVLMARKMQENGASGVAVINRFPALEIDVETGRPLLHSSLASVGGPWMRPIMLRWVARVAREVDIAISAVNGVWEWPDVVKAIMVGASTVQTCRALTYSPNGFNKINDFVNGLESYMIRKGYQNIAEIRGATLGQILTWDKVDRVSRAVAKIGQEQCTGCKMCSNWCFCGAICFDDKGIAVINDKKCDGCGLCAALCPDNAVHMERPYQVYLGDFS